MTVVLTDMPPQVAAWLLLLRLADTKHPIAASSTVSRGSEAQSCLLQKYH